MTHIDTGAEESHPVFPWFTEPRRAWFYRVLLSCSGLVVIYGLVSGEQAAAWVGLGVALSNVTPVVNTSTK